MTNIKHYFDGKTYTTIKDATISYDSYTDLHKFTAHAICDTDTVDADGYQKRYILTWKIENPDAEQEEDMCNWDKIEDVKEYGEYSVSEDRYY